MEQHTYHYRALLVDDEQNVLNAIRRELTTQPLANLQFEVELFTSPQAALGRAKEQAFDIIIADYRMPEMDGIALLHKFSYIQPDAVRILISGQADMDAVHNAINESHVYRFLPKPWDENDLKNTVIQALTWRRELLRNRQLADLAKKAGITLPAPEHEELCEIMIVDDSEAVNHALWRDLTTHSQFDSIYAVMMQEAGDNAGTTGQPLQFSVSTFTSPLAALEAAKSRTFQCVIADYRMPEMDGIEFLDKLAEIQPDCAHIMISANADMALLLEAINRAHVHSFINKPWGAFELKLAVTDAVAQRNLGIENRMLANALRQHSTRH